MTMIKSGQEPYPVPIRHPRAGGDPGHRQPTVSCPNSSSPRRRRPRSSTANRILSQFVIPAQAGPRMGRGRSGHPTPWAPAYAGVTIRRSGSDGTEHAGSTANRALSRFVIPAQAGTQVIDGQPYPVPIRHPRAGGDPGWKGRRSGHPTPWAPAYAGVTIRKGGSDGKERAGMTMIRSGQEPYPVPIRHPRAGGDPCPNSSSPRRRGPRMGRAA